MEGAGVDGAVVGAAGGALGGSALTAAGVGVYEAAYSTYIIIK